MCEYDIHANKTGIHAIRKGSRDCTELHCSGSSNPPLQVFYILEALEM